MSPLVHLHEVPDSKINSKEKSGISSLSETLMCVCVCVCGCTIEQNEKL